MIAKLDLNLGLVDRVVSLTESESREEAIHHALREIERRGKLAKTLREGTGVPKDELPNVIDSASYPENEFPKGDEFSQKGDQ